MTVVNSAAAAVFYFLSPVSLTSRVSRRFPSKLAVACFLWETQWYRPWARCTRYVTRYISKTAGRLPPHRSDYRKYLRGQVIRIRLKIEQNCRLFLDFFSGAIMNDLSMTFTSRLKVDAKCVYQQWNGITVANYFGTPPADWVHKYLYFEPGAWIWTKGFRHYWHIVKNWSGNFSLNSVRVHALGWPLLGNFPFPDFFFFSEGGLWGKSFIGNI